ncbi:MAG: hypothetical protein ACRDS0_03875 [Pseudonocardiaceae bacterium]
MVTHRRPGPNPDEMITGALHTIAIRGWVPPTGPDREARLNELRDAARGRTDLLIQVAGVILGTRVDDEYDPRYVKHTAGAAMLLELADVTDDDPQVQRWFAAGRERRDRNRIRLQHDW